MIENNEKYNPANFIADNIQEILPENSILKEISFSGYIKRLFQTNNRPNGIVSIIYQKDQKENEIKLFVKQHQNAKTVFDQMSVNYQNLMPSKANRHIPKPVICDEDQNANYMEYFKGTTLKYTVLRELILNKRKKLYLLFQNIGQWLNEYHHASLATNYTTIDDVKINILKALKDSDYFHENEKKRITEKLHSISIADKKMSLVKPHNDFALRNIIYLKSGNFVVIDWDAMFHKKFPSEAPIWNDLTSFFINILSLSRFSPLIKKSDINELINAFTKGYFRNNDRIGQEDINNFFFLFSLSFYMGIIGDRPIPDIYKTRLGSKFINSLHKKIVNGTMI